MRANRAAKAIRMMLYLYISPESSVQLNVHIIRGPGTRSIAGNRPVMASEVEAKRKLQVAFATTNAAALCRYFSEVGAGRVEVDAASAASTPVRVVDEVERLRAELEPSLLVNWERFEQAEVPILEPGLVDKVANALCVKRSNSRLG